MNTAFWAQVHGATTHFPLALTVCSGAFDGAGFALADRPVGRGLKAAGYWTILLSAACSLPAVASGLLMSKGTLLGHGALRMHHLFVWPTFALIVALGTWRALDGGRARRLVFAGYLLLTGVATALILTAGYWGGEMMMAR